MNLLRRLGYGVFCRTGIGMYDKKGLFILKNGIIKINFQYNQKTFFTVFKNSRGILNESIGQKIR